MIIKGRVEKEGERKRVKPGTKCHTSRSITLIFFAFYRGERQRHTLEGRVGVLVIDGEITGGKRPHN